LLTDRESIVRMRCAAGFPSGTVLWSVSLPTGKEMDVTWSVPGLGGGVRHDLPLRRGERGYDVRVLR
jgi:hypothetical protein